MEYLLIELFGGGTADWEMIGETNYDWHTILERAKDIFGYIDNIDFQCLLEMIFVMAQEDFSKMVDKFIEENRNNEEYKEIIEKLKSVDFEDDGRTWQFDTNYLACSITLFVDKEVKNILEEYLQDEIDKINDNIGFTYIAIESE